MALCPIIGYDARMASDFDSRPTAPISSAVGPLLRMVAAAIGVALVVVGLMFVVRVLSGIPAALKDPKSAESLVSQWSDTLGFEEGGLVEYEGQKFPVGRIVAVLLLGGGAMVIGSVALKCVTAGTSILLSAAFPPR